MRTRGFEVIREDMRRTSGNILLPKRGTIGSAGYDFFANDNYNVEPNQIAKIWTDVKAYMQDNEVLLLDVRSSMGGKFMLANTIGVIDASYYSNENNDGCIGVFLKNISNTPILIKKGEAIAQGIFINYLTTDDDNVTETRKGGFGSTNKGE
jgi:dUTP pyrophosphatase